MKAKLRLENIGQRIGEEIWEFNSGVVTEIRGRTASGKSRILKSCALVLSLPITSEEIMENAISFGIAKAENSECSPLLNSNKNKAVIDLQFDDITKKVELNRDGTEKINTPGNQNFLYCSMLTENSKIHNNIDQGISDFSWIVTEMSLAKDYEAIQEIVESYSDLLKSKKEEIEKNEIENKKNETLLEKKRKELEEINNKIEKLTKEIEATKLDPLLDQKYYNLTKEIRELKDKQNKDKKNLKESENELSNIENIINTNNEQIEKNLREIKKLKIQKEELVKIDTTTLTKDIEALFKGNEELSEFNTKISESNANLRESIGRFDVKIEALEDDLKVLNDNLNRLIETKKDKVICWTCNNGYLDLNDLKKKVEEKEKERSNSKKELKGIEESIKSTKNEIENNKKKIESNKLEIRKRQELKKKKNEITDIEIKIQNLSGKTAILKKEKDNQDEKNKIIVAKIPSYKANIQSQTKKIEQKEKERDLIDSQMKKNKEAEPKVIERKKLTKKSGSVEKEISDLEFRIDQASIIEILGFKIDVSKAKMIIEDLDSVIYNINDYLVSNIKEQREGAAIKFNENITKIIKELNFSEFNEISLDLENYNLNIIRKDNTYQPINSLSGGEKVVVSSLLQISAKETYNRDIPFIIGDDIILKMDDTRREIFENYLKTIAKENDWFIILTRITDEDLIKVEI